MVLDFVALLNVSTTEASWNMNYHSNTQVISPLLPLSPRPYNQEVMNLERDQLYVTSGYAV